MAVAMKLAASTQAKLAIMSGVAPNRLTTNVAIDRPTARISARTRSVRAAIPAHRRTDPPSKRAASISTRLRANSQPATIDKVDRNLVEFSVTNRIPASAVSAPASIDRRRALWRRVPAKISVMPASTSNVPMITEL